MDKKKIKRSGIREITWVHKAFLIAFVDILLILAAYMMALILRFDFIFSRIPREYLEGYLWSMPTGLPLPLLSFTGAGCITVCGVWPVSLSCR